MRHRLAVIGVLVVLMVLSGCFTGKRPSFTADPFPGGASSGDPAIDQVLALLDAANTGPYTADYTVLIKFGNATRDAHVAVSGVRRSVTVGNVRFLTNGAASQTCVLNGSGDCSSTIDPARISDTQLTPDFYGIDSATRLRRLAPARVGPPVAHIDTIAGQAATCVDVAVSGGTAVYCAVPNGPLARLDDASVAITLTKFAVGVDEALFSTTG
jgi:hypothetical protein